MQTETRRQRQEYISIHALRVEGDTGARLDMTPEEEISIHALRVEGDRGTGRRCLPA